MTTVVIKYTFVALYSLPVILYDAEQIYIFIILLVPSNYLPVLPVANQCHSYAR